MKQELELLALKALNEGKCLKFRYDGFVRTVEVHAIGTSHKGNSVMRCYQISGKSASNSKGWKMIRFDKIEACRILKTKSKAPREHYVMNDKGMKFITSQFILS